MTPEMVVSLAFFLFGGVKASGRGRAVPNRYNDPCSGNWGDFFEWLE